MFPGFNSNEGTAEQQQLVVKRQSVGSPVLLLYPRINSLVCGLFLNPHRTTLAPQPQGYPKARPERGFPALFVRSG